MPRDLPLSNGTLLVNFDHAYRLRDLYWPHLGQENHTSGHPFRFGVWADGRFFWIDDPGWERSLAYFADTLVSDVRLYHPGLALTLFCQDVVDFHENLYLRRIEVHNHAGPERHGSAIRDVRLFFSHDFYVSGQDIGNSAYYEPERRVLMHYRGQRWFLINAAKAMEHECSLGIDQWAVGVKDVSGLEGTWRDAEDGALSGNSVAQGSVDSTAALHLSVGNGSPAVGWYWIAVGDNFEEVARLNRAVRKKGPASLLERTRSYWSLWVNKEQEAFSCVPDPLVQLYKRSLLVLRTQIDNYPPNTFLLVPDMLSKSPLSFAVRYDSLDLLEWINLFFLHTQLDGRLDQNLDYWVNSQAWKKDH